MSPTAKAPEPTTYLLRDIDADVWARFKERADDEGFTARALLLYLVRAYADGEFSTVVQLPARAPRKRAKR
jgi:hypothetical protein